MLDKLGYDIQLAYAKQKGAPENEQRKTHCIYGCNIGDHHDNIGAGIENRRQLTGASFWHSGRISSPIRFPSSGLAPCG